MRKLLMAGAAGVAALAIPSAVTAQDTNADRSTSVTTDAQPDGRQQAPGRVTDRQPPATANSAQRPGEIRFVGGEVVQRTSGEPPSEYPVCKGDTDDRCINAWAAGERGPGVTRPLDHWPGRPASERN